MNHKFQTQEDIGAMLRKFRKDREKRQVDLGVHSGLDEGWICRTEKGKQNPCLENLLRYTNSMGLEIRIVERDQTD